MEIFSLLFTPCVSFKTPLKAYKASVSPSLKWEYLPPSDCRGEQEVNEDNKVLNAQAWYTVCAQEILTFATLKEKEHQMTVFELKNYKSDFL